MSYYVTIFQKFDDGDVTKTKTHTDSFHLHEAFDDARMEAMTVRLHTGRDYTKPPIFETISAYPTLSLKKWYIALVGF